MSSEHAPDDELSRGFGHERRSPVSAMRGGVDGSVCRLPRASLCSPCLRPTSGQPTPGTSPVYHVTPIGSISKADGRTFVEVERRYQPALMGAEDLEAVWVLYWFDRNDTPHARGILQVHPRGNPQNPLRGCLPPAPRFARI